VFVRQLHFASTSSYSDSSFCEASAGDPKGKGKGKNKGIRALKRSAEQSQAAPDDGAGAVDPVERADTLRWKWVQAKYSGKYSGLNKWTEAAKLARELTSRVLIAELLSLSNVLSSQTRA
jgi:hypothetical protein